MALQEELDRLCDGQRRNAPPGILDVSDKTIQFVASTGLTAHAVREGDRAPDFELASVRGGPSTSAQSLPRGL